MYYEHTKAKTNEISMDRQNEEILRFCSYLFNNWLEDYVDYCERAKDRNLTHHKWFINQGMEKNIADKCLPIDFFMEKMLQVGLVSSMPSMKSIIDIMLKFDNAGFVEKSNQASMDQLPENSTLQSSVVDNSKLNDNFTPINSHNKEAVHYMRSNLD